MDSSHSQESVEQFHSTVWEEKDKEQMHRSSKSAQPKQCPCLFLCNVKHPSAPHSLLLTAACLRTSACKYIAQYVPWGKHEHESY